MPQARRGKPPIKPKTELGHIIRASADEYAGGLDELADVIGVTGRTLRNLLNGESSSLGTLRIIADYLLPEHPSNLEVIMSWHECRSR